MWMLVLMLCGFQEPEEFVLEVRGYHILENPKPVAGSWRILLLTDTPNIAKQDNSVLISIDDLGLIAPVGCTIRVTGNQKTIDLGNGSTVSGVWVNRREQIKIVGLAKEVIPKLTPHQRSKFGAVTENDFLRGQTIPVPPTQKTGMGFPGGKK